MKPSGKKRGGARPGAGQPPFQPTDSERALVQALRGAGFGLPDIASQVGPRGISEPTLTKHFAHELATGTAKINGICVTGLVKKMQAGDLGALCFWAKTRMGWREKSDVNLTGAVKHEHSNIERLAAELDLIAARTGKTPVS